jgi:DNA-binding beta-propeller fold protein YncE
VEWKKNAISGRVVAAGNGQGNQNHQLYRPSMLTVDKENDSLIICDRGNQIVVRWSRRNGQSGEILISNINCFYVIMDNDGYLYVSDEQRHEVIRRNGKGDRLDQLNFPANLFIDEDYSVYVSDHYNRRVMK